MGFFSGLVSSPKVKTPASGLYAQTPQYRDIYNNIADDTLGTLQAVNAQSFTPTALNSGEQAALGQYYQGFTPDAQSLQSDISMLSNPFDEYVVGGINREAMGQNSLVNQQAAQTGQMGSNRNFLATSDVEQNRLNNVGQFKQSQYNTAVNQSLGALTASRRQDAAGALSAGTYERDLAMQQQQAPLEAIRAQQGLLGRLDQVEGNPYSTQGGGINAQAIAKTVGGLAGFFSDERLKQDIEHIGIENGHNIYKFAYKADPSRLFVGVMAQQVERTHPDAVKEIDGYKAVDYDAIGVDFREYV